MFFRSLRLALLPALFLLLLLPAEPVRAKSGAPEPPGQNLFLNASIDNRSPWVGQEVQLTYSLLFRGVAPKISDEGKPEHAGLWMQEITPEGYIRSTPSAVNGRVFNKAVIKTLKLLPMQAGQLRVSNYRLRCLLPADNGSAGTAGTDTEIIVTGPTVTLEARQLPQPVPRNFSGAVGSFRLMISPEKSHIHAGEPLVLTVTISGKGNLKSFPPVAFSSPDGLRQDQPDMATIVQEQPGRPDESVSTRIRLTAERTGTFHFSPVSLVYFDPGTRRYETTPPREITVTVLPAAAAPAKKGSPDTAAIKPAQAPVLMIISVAAAIIIMGAVYAVVRKYRSSSKCPPHVQAFESGIAAGSEARHSVEALRNHLYDALKPFTARNPAGMTGAQLKQTLTSNRVPEEAAEELLNLLSMIDRAIYTPGSIPAGEMESLCRKASEVLKAIRKR